MTNPNLFNYNTMNDFYSVIQLLATLAIGFVILGYSEFFIDMLKTKFFHVDEAINEAEKRCYAAIPDGVTRKNLEPVKLGEDGNDTSKDIENLRLKCEEKEKSVKTFIDKSREDLDRKSKLKSLVSMSLFVFMASVTLIFVPSLKSFVGFFNLFLLPFSLLCIVYIVLGWIYGEKDNGKSKLKRFDTLKHPVIWFAIICLLSLAFAFWKPIDIGELWRHTCVALVVTGWLNYVIYAFIVKHSMDQLKASVEAFADAMVKGCEEDELKKSCDFLIGTMIRDNRNTDFYTAGHHDVADEATECILDTYFGIHSESLHLIVEASHLPNPAPPTDPK